MAPRRAASVACGVLVCATLAACALAAPRVVGDDVRAVPSVPRGVGERSVSKGKLSCGECELIVSLAQKIAENATTIERLIHALDGKCQKLFAANPKLEALCEDLSKDLLDLLPWIFKVARAPTPPPRPPPRPHVLRQELQGLAWDEPIGICAVFIPVCKIPCCPAATPQQPEQLHLSLTSRPGQMAVTWVTLQDTAASVVQFGVHGGALNRSADGSNLTRTYTHGGWVGVVHSAVMSGLAPGTRYDYRVGDGAAQWSAVQTFATLPADVGSEARPLRFLQVGDMAYDAQSDATVAAMRAEVDQGLVDVIFHVGDVGYADGYMKHWDMFFRKIEPIAARVPYMSGPGNHEFWFNFSAYKTRFYMPMFESTQNMFYSLDVGPMHFVMYDTETFLDTANIDAVQMRWLRADLAAASARRSAVPWLVVAGHRPLYCSNKQHTQCGVFATWLRKLSEDLFVSSAVDVVVQAHMHDMELSWPLAHGNVTQRNYDSPTAPVYVVNGAGGNREGNDHMRSVQPWSAFTSGAVGYARVAVAGAGSLHWQFIVAANASVAAEFTITKATH